MKKLKLSIIFAFVAFAAAGLSFSDPLMNKVSSLGSGPPPGVTGAPGESSCNECHAGGEGNGTFVIIAPPSYQPGQTYQVQVRHTSTNVTRKRWGFQMTALNENTQAAGTFQNLSLSTQTLSDLGRNYVEHTAPGTFPNQTGGAQWTFTWTAPASDVGTVTFFAAGNQANNDQTNDGDEIYYTQTNVPFGTGPTPSPTPTPSPSPTPTPVPTPTPTPTPSPTPTPTPTPTPSPTPTPTPTPTPSPSPTPTPSITPTPTPTPVPVGSITGRVFTPSLQGLRNAVVTLIDSANVRRTATTSSFGVYSFTNLTLNETYTLTVASKRYRFSPRILVVDGNLLNIDLVGLE